MRSNKNWVRNPFECARLIWMWNGCLSIKALWDKFNHCINDNANETQNRVQYVIFVWKKLKTNETNGKWHMNWFGTCVMSLLLCFSLETRNARKVWILLTQKRVALNWNLNKKSSCKTKKKEVRHMIKHEHKTCNNSNNNNNQIQRMNKRIEFPNLN